MKKYFLLLFVYLIVSCNKYKLNCNFSGEQKTKTFILDDFDTIEVNPLIQLKLIDDDHNEISIKADKNIMDNIDVEIVNRKLKIANNTHCIVKNSKAIAYITLKVDDIQQIIANTDLKIISGNTLHFNYLKLTCENSVVGTNNLCDFDLNLQVNKLDIVANGRSIFKVTGNVHQLFVGFYGVAPVFQGENLIANTVRVFQRSSNDIHVYPLNKISGDLFGYGDIYIYHHPQIFNITEHGRGHIYFVN